MSEWICGLVLSYSEYQGIFNLGQDVLRDFFVSSLSPVATVNRGILKDDKIAVLNETGSLTFHVEKTAHSSPCLSCYIIKNEYLLYQIPKILWFVREVTYSSLDRKTPMSISFSVD